MVEFLRDSKLFFRSPLSTSPPAPPSVPSNILYRFFFKKGDRLLLL